MADLQETLEALNYKCWYYETAKNLGSTKAVDELPNSALPDELRAVRARLHEE